MSATPWTGGLLMGVEMNQHPELWSAVQIAVPLLDMIRYEQIAAGASWVGEYGCVSIPAERAFLASISPYQNLKKGAKYPTPSIWTTTRSQMKLTSATQIKQHKVSASPDNPEYLVRSEKSGAIAAHITLS